MSRRCNGCASDSSSLAHFRHHLQRVEYRIVGTFLILFGLLLFLEFLRQFRGDLRGVLLVEMLHQPFGNTGLAVIHGTLTRLTLNQSAKCSSSQMRSVLTPVVGRSMTSVMRSLPSVQEASMSVTGGPPYVNAERIGDAMHHFAHAEASRTCAPNSSMPTRTITLALAAMPASVTGLSRSRSMSSMSRGME